MKFEKIIIKGIEISLMIFAVGSPFSISLAQIGFVSALVFWILRLIFIRDVKLKGTFIDIFLLIYIIGLFLSSIFSIKPIESLKANKNIWLFSMIYLIVNNVDLNFSKRLLKIILISATLSGVYGIFQSLTGIDIVRGRLNPYGRYFYGAWGGFGLHLTYGGYQMMIAIIFLAIMIYSLSSFNDIKIRVLIIFASIVNILSVLASFSRAAWAGFLAGILALIGISLFTRKRIGFIVIGVFIILILLFLIIPDIKNRFFLTLNPLKDLPRKEIWSGSLEMIKDHPIFGVGSGMFARHFENYKPDFKNLYGKVYCHPHNDFLAAYLRAGIIGFIGFIMIFAVFIIKMFKFYNKLLKEGFKLYSSLMLGFVSSVIGFLVAGLGQNYFTDSENAMLLFFVFGISFVIYNNFYELRRWKFMNLKAEIKKIIPAKYEKFPKLSGGNDYHKNCDNDYHFDKFGQDLYGQECLYYWFYSKNCAKKNQKRVVLSEVENLVNSCLSKGYFDRNDFNNFCPQTNSAGPCGFAVIVRILEYLGIAKYKGFGIVKFNKNNLF